LLFPDSLLVVDPERFYRSREKRYRLSLRESPIWDRRRQNLCMIGKVYRMYVGVANFTGFLKGKSAIQIHRDLLKTKALYGFQVGNFLVTIISG